MSGPSDKFRLAGIRPAEWLAAAVLPAAAVWPFMHVDSVRQAPPPSAATATIAAEAGHARADARKDCSACPGLQALARRFEARAEGAARRYAAASDALSATLRSPDNTRRRQLQAALRVALDDRRGAARFGEAVRNALQDCESGPGCGAVTLNAHWPDGCPPEDPVLTPEIATLGALVHRLSRVASACAAAACPVVDCGAQRRIIDVMRVIEADLAALEDAAPPPASGDAAAADGAVELLEDVERWRDRMVALFLGSSRPQAHMRQLAAEAGGLSERLNAAVTRAGDLRAGAHPPGAAGALPLAAMRTLAARLLRLRGTLEAYAAAAALTGPARDGALGRARNRAAGYYRAVLVDAARLRFRLDAAAGGPEHAPRACTRRRRAQIARARGQIRATRAALRRCRLRGACRSGKPASIAPPDGAGEIDRISLRRARVDAGLARLERLSRAMTVSKQAPVMINTAQDRYRAGEAIAVRMDMRQTACMAEPGAWVGLFPGAAPRLRAPEAKATAVRLIPLRGRPWEEVLFEAPARPDVYEVRTYRAPDGGGAMTGAAKITVKPLKPGCDGFNGQWKTNFGELRLTVRGGEASGSYKRRAGFRAGFLMGKVKGRVLLGQWQSDLGGGGTRLVLSKDGKTFTGTWSHFRDEFAGTGTWNGRCMIAVAPPGR